MNRGVADGRGKCKLLVAVKSEDRINFAHTDESSCKTSLCLWWRGCRCATLMFTTDSRPLGESRWWYSFSSPSSCSNARPAKPPGTLLCSDHAWSCWCPLTECINTCIETKPFEILLISSYMLSVVQVHSAHGQCAATGTCHSVGICRLLQGDLLS